MLLDSKEGLLQKPHSFWKNNYVPEEHSKGKPWAEGCIPIPSMATVWLPLDQCDLTRGRVQLKTFSESGWLYKYTCEVPCVQAEQNYIPVCRKGGPGSSFGAVTLLFFLLTAGLEITKWLERNTKLKRCNLLPKGGRRKLEAFKSGAEGDFRSKCMSNKWKGWGGVA
uniref:Uncharacterized protein n=1 Tax=Micrurus lemniscatus lemniscatus TaxID=129467 RepID=A0A2D4IWS7_MICLE